MIWYPCVLVLVIVTLFLYMNFQYKHLCDLRLPLKFSFQDKIFWLNDVLKYREQWLIYMYYRQFLANALNEFTTLEDV